MIIRSKNRLYIFDRHISDAVLRLAVLFLVFFFGFSSFLFLVKTDVTIDSVFWTRLQNFYADTTGKESFKPGTSEKSIYTIVSEQLEKDGALITQFPDYAEKISPNNRSVELVRFKLRDLRLLARTTGLICLAICIFLFLITRIIYGNGESKFRVFRLIFLTFNHDHKYRQPHGCAHFFSPLQRKVFEAVFFASKGNPDGTFEFNLLNTYKLLWPEDETPTETRRGQLTQAFFELCEEYFYFPIPFGKSFVLKALCPIVPFEEQVERGYSRDLRGKEVEVYLGGKFRFSTPLFKEFLRYRYSKLPHPVAYALNDRKNPYAFRIYLCLWEKFVDMRDDDDRKISIYSIPIPLYDLMETVCFEMAYGHEKNLLELFHADISAMKEIGLIKSWFIEEHGDKVGLSWYKDAELFLYDAQNNSYHLNTKLLTYKIYFFELAPPEALDKIKMVKRRCAYRDEFDTPCSRPALPNSPYCRRHAKVLEYDGQRIFKGRVKALEAPQNVPQEQADGASDDEEGEFIVVESEKTSTDSAPTANEDLGENEKTEPEPEIPEKASPEDDEGARRD